MERNIVTIAHAHVGVLNPEFLLLFQIVVLQLSLGQGPAVLIRAEFDGHTVQPHFFYDFRCEHTRARHTEITNTKFYFHSMTSSLTL